MTATCVEAIWQGLKVFEGAGIDQQLFRNDTMHNIKRTVRKYGKPLGHQFGVFSKEILNYADARRYIYVPSYKYVLDNVSEVHSIVERIKKQAETSDIVLLDYNINPDNRDITRPLSHAELVKMYIEGRYPSKDEDFVPYTLDELKSLNQKPRRLTVRRKEIKTKEDELQLIQQISELLKDSERSAKEICDLLAIDCDGRTIKKYLKKIPGLKSHKERKTVFFTLMDQDPNPTLF